MKVQTDGKLMMAIMYHVLAEWCGNLQGRHGGVERYRHPGRVKARGVAGEHKNGGWIRVIKKLSIKFRVEPSIKSSFPFKYPINWSISSNSVEK